MKNYVKTPEQALSYLTDCTLATVASMAIKKSRSKHEFERQISIAQCAVDWIRDFNIEVIPGERIHHVLSTPDQKVETWVKSFIIN